MERNAPRLKPILIKVDRICAWSLVVIFVVFFVTGYGMTKGLISPDLSKAIHGSVLPIPAFFAFAFHSAYGAHVALKRWRVWSPAWSYVLVVYVAVMLVGAIIFQVVLATAGGAAPVPARIEL